MIWMTIFFSYSMRLEMQKNESKVYYLCLLQLQDRNKQF